MRHAILCPDVYYGWLIAATIFWMAMLSSGGCSDLGVFVIPMSEELGRSHAHRVCLEMSR